MNRSRPIDWRNYTSTLGLALHAQRAQLELLEAAHVGDADTVIEQAQELHEMLAALLADFDVEPRRVSLLRRHIEHASQEIVRLRALLGRHHAVNVMDRMRWGEECPACVRFQAEQAEQAEPPADGISIRFTCERCNQERPACEVDIGPAGEPWCTTCVAAVAKARDLKERHREHRFDPKLDATSPEDGQS